MYVLSFSKAPPTPHSNIKIALHLSPAFFEHIQNEKKIRVMHKSIIGLKTGTKRIEIDCVTFYFKAFCISL